MSQPEVDTRAAGRRQLAPIYAAGFVTAFGAHAVAANMARYAIGHRSSLFELGLLLAVYDGAEVVLKPVFGALVDRKGPKPVMVGGLLAFALASAGFVAAHNPNLLGLARLAQGSAAAAFSPAAGAAIASFGGKKRTGRLFGGYGGAKSLGYLLGPVAGGVLIVVGGYDLLFAVLALTALVATILVIRRVPHVVTTPRTRSSIADLLGQITRVEFLRPVLVLAAAAGALSAAVGFLPLLGARHHLGILVTGTLVSVLAATCLVIQPLAGRLHDEGRLPLQSAAFALAACALGFSGAIVVPGIAGIAVAALFIGSGVAVSTPLGFAALAACAPPDRMGRTMGAGEVGRELGDAGGPLIVGAAGAVSLLVGLGALAAALLAAAGLSLPARPFRPPEEPQ